jgi:hypothetical protein
MTYFVTRKSKIRDNSFFSLAYTAVYQVYSPTAIEKLLGYSRVDPLCSFIHHPVPTPSVYVLPLTLEERYHIHIKQQVKLQFFSIIILIALCEI